MPHRTKLLEERLISDIDDLLKHRTVHIKDGPMMYVSGKNSVYKLDELHYMGLHNRENQCFYSKKHNMTFFFFQHHGAKYRLFGAFDGDCNLSDYIIEEKKK